MPMGFDKNIIKNWQSRLASGHTETWLATFITLWAIGVVAFSWYLASKKSNAVKWILAGIILYEVLP